MKRTMEGDLYELRDLAEAIGLKYHALYDRVYRSHTVPPPARRYGRRDYYSPEEFGRIVAAILDQPQVAD